MKVIECFNVEKKIKEKVLFSNLSFSVDENDFFLISGKSGSGKTTLLNLISVKDKHYNGNIFILEKNIRKIHFTEKHDLLNSVIGFVYQDYGLIKNRTVKENIYMPYVYSDSKEDLEWYEKIMTLFQLKHKENEIINVLSGGEKQRTSIARALILKPRVIIFDEPFSNLDIENQEKLVDLLKEINQITKSAIIVVSHIVPQKMKCLITKTVNMEDYNESN